MSIDTEETLAREADVAALLDHTRILANNWVNNWKFAPGVSIVAARGTDHRASVNVGRVGVWESAPAATYDSLWRQYSMTKTVTAIAAMTLVDSGRMKLTDPLSKYFHEFADMKVMADLNISPTWRVKTMRPAASPITILNLMTHTAGMGYSMDPGPLEHLYFDKGINPWQIDLALEGLLRLTRPTSLREFAHKVSELPLCYDPGTVWAYSIGLDVLAAVIEHITGDFVAYVQEKVFDPLGMESSYWTVPEGERHRMSTCFTPETGHPTTLITLDPREDSVWYEAPSFAYGGAGLVMSALDYDQLLYMLMNGGTLNGNRVLSETAVNTALSDLLPRSVDVSQLERMVGAKPGAVGFGAGGYVLRRKDDGNGRAAGTYGWGGFAGTSFWIDREKKVRASGMVNVLPHMSNTHPPYVVRLVSPLVESVYQDLTPGG